MYTEENLVRILHIEDDAADAMYVDRILSHNKQFDSQKRVVTRLTEAVDALKEEPYDVILMDLNLPDSQGIDTFHDLRKQIKELPPVILISGHSDRNIAQNTIFTGAQDFLKKDSLSETLIHNVIENAIWRQKYMRELQNRTRELTESESRFRSIVEVATDAMFIIDADGIIQFANPASMKLFDRREEDFVGAPFGFPISHKRDMFELDIHRSDGTVGVAEMRTSTLTWNGKKAFLASLRDITKRVEDQKKISRMARMHRIMSGINNLIVRVNNQQELFAEAVRIAVIDGELSGAWIGEYHSEIRDLKIVAWHGCSESYVKAINRQITETLTMEDRRDIFYHVSVKQRPVVINDIDSDQRAQSQIECKRAGVKSLALFPIVLGKKIAGVIALHSKEKDFFTLQETKLLIELTADIAFALDHLEKIERLDHLANYDTVTDLPNRALLKDRLKQAFHFADRYQLNTAILFIDLDRFKLVNDTLGHAIGDEVLKVAASRIRSCIRKTDTVARIGGDEFIVILAGNQSDDRNITSTAQRIVDAFGKSINLEGQEIVITCSIGVSVYSGGGTDPDILLRNADTAMYRVKEQGGNNYLHYRVGFDKYAQDRLSLETSLRNAVQRNELVVYYQPRLDYLKRSIIGVEALVRWNHPAMGILPPSLFIPIAEETGLIIQIGEWVLRTACLQSHAWGNLNVSVNLSARQFRQADLVKTVAQILQESQLEPKFLELELTESMLMTNVEAAINTMTGLRELGVHLSLDDFGTGYSSLSYLKRFPINTVKIDQSFVREITTDKDCMAIVEAIIAMARSLNLTVVAEGVETSEQLTAVCERGCDQLQGFLIAEPLPAEELEKRLREEGRRIAAPMMRRNKGQNKSKAEQPCSKDSPQSG